MVGNTLFGPRNPFFYMIKRKGNQDFPSAHAQRNVHLHELYNLCEYGKCRNVHLYEFPSNAKWGNNEDEHSCLSLSWASQGLSKSLESLVPHLHVQPPQLSLQEFSRSFLQEGTEQVFPFSRKHCWKCPRAEGRFVGLRAHSPLLSL